MPVRAAYAYRNGQRLRPVSLEEPVPPDADFAWISIVDPDEMDLTLLARRCALHPQIVRDAGDEHVRPKLTLRGDEIVVNARTVTREGDAIRYGTLALFLGRDHLISVRVGDFADPQSVRDQLEEAPDLLAQGVDYVLYAVLDFVVAGYLAVVESVEEDLFELERRALDTFLR
uniref:CorA family divalent cation transporter n=1 Tax=Aureimonas sp. AU4 TaxID=1638163 RepID=UPI000AF54072